MFWYGVGIVLVVWRCYVSRLVLVWVWYGVGMVSILFCVVLVSVRHGVGIVLVWFGIDFV